jgi:hypothetical protein
MSSTSKVRLGEFALAATARKLLVSIVERRDISILSRKEYTKQTAAVAAVPDELIAFQSFLIFEMLRSLCGQMGLPERP